MADNGTLAGCEVIISSDSHVMEPSDILVERAPKGYKDQVPRFPQLKVGESFQTQPGGSDPDKRIAEMETDGVSAEVLFPTYLLQHFAMDDAKLQEVSFRAYNDWLVDYCSVAPNRLVGVAAISMYDIDEAVKELERCAKAGLKGSLIWQAPRMDLPFSSGHYEKFWAASDDLQLPVHLHILTGHGYHKQTVFGNKRIGVEPYRGSVNLKLQEIINAVFDFIFYGIMERHPRLKFVCVENEIGWMPFMLQQWDYYWNRCKGDLPISITRNPSEYFNEQFFGTFFRDTVAGHNFEWWGQDNCMWSNDYPHANSTWPESKLYIERDLGHLPADIRKKLVCTNVKNLYQLDVPDPVQYPIARKLPAPGVVRRGDDQTAGDGRLAGCEVLISADSHVMEPSDILVERAPKGYKDQVPRLPKGPEELMEFNAKPGGSDPHKRITEMETDGVSAEVLFPTYLLLHFAMDDAKLQEVSFRAYNDWLVDYCSVAPNRLVGVAAISMYNIDEAVKELERCAKAGLKGSLIWQAPRMDLPFRSDHYEKFWAASEDLQLPVHLHVSTGHNSDKRILAAAEKRGLDNLDQRSRTEFYRYTVNVSLREIINAVFDLIFYGVMERHPKLKFVSLENEVGWIPFMLQQWDYYWNRFKGENPISITRNPSEYFLEQVYGTFFGDTVGGRNFEWWGQDNCMWSNDYPHGSSTWPESIRYIERDLGHLPADVRKKLVYTNVKELYRLDIPHPAQ